LQFRTFEISRVAVNSPVNTGRNAKDVVLRRRDPSLSGQFSGTQLRDQALALQFTDKERLSEFFLKGRELFPVMALEVLSTFSCEEHVIAEWKVTGTETLSYGSLRFRFPISYQGTSIVRIENEGITYWPDYYDQSTSRRFRLGSLFTEWIEY